MSKREILTRLSCVLVGAAIGAGLVSLLYLVLIKLGVFVDYN